MSTPISAEQLPPDSRQTTVSSLPPERAPAAPVQPDLAALLAALAQTIAAHPLPGQPASRAADTMAPSVEFSEARSRVEHAGKHWLTSMTMLGTALTAAATVLPVVGPFVGLPISPAAAQLLGEQLFLAVQAIGGVVGTGLIVAGRARAAVPLTRGAVTLKL